MFSFRGVDLDALLDMSTDEVVKLFTIRARRRFQRGLTHKPMALIKKLRKAFSKKGYSRRGRRRRKRKTSVCKFGRRRRRRRRRRRTCVCKFGRRRHSNCGFRNLFNCWSNCMILDIVIFVF
ncbi:uncharacterized protein LOC107646641 isoform X4 [Arachis ipaensis]|uniref:uncharacterized protein LOC107646641 isoform X4 n=1 Tax=Arachis ipaensis TaxID=130454 RepID=UPI000A2B6DA8|nr:uncharacterized protein LOC107646641 isoform X4 [Arachis ipaensis]XP_025663251.1 uncharacterized protein LOC112758735 isoform X3 [Arachis hypogaea]